MMSGIWLWGHLDRCVYTKPRSDNLEITESSSQLLWTECFLDYDEHLMRFELRTVAILQAQRGP